MVGCHCGGSLGRVPWKQFLSELSLVLICCEVGIVTANHILGHFSAFVAMGIGVFRSFVFCEKRGVLLPLLAYALRCAEGEGGLWSVSGHQEETSGLGTGCEVTLFKLSPAVQCLPLCWLLQWVVMQSTQRGTRAQVALLHQPWVSDAIRWCQTDRVGTCPCICSMVR